MKYINILSFIFLLFISVSCNISALGVFQTKILRVKVLDKGFFVKEVLLSTKFTKIELKTIYFTKTPEKEFYLDALLEKHNISQIPSNELLTFVFIFERIKRPDIQTSSIISLNYDDVFLKATTVTLKRPIY